jgi:hypothetical protein
MRLALPLALALVAAGCSSSGGPDQSTGKLSCPDTLIAPNLDAYTVFKPGAGTAPQDIQFGVKLVTVKSNCFAEKTGIRVETVVSFVVVRNDPEFKTGDFGYFIAVADSNQAVLSKQNFGLRADFAPRQVQMRVLDTMTERLPVKDLAAGRNYAIIVGLQLDQAQLELNRPAAMLVSSRHRTPMGETGTRLPAPKEQPPRKLSGKRTVGDRALWKAGERMPNGALASPTR